MKQFFLATPGLLLCGIIWLLQIEKTHYGFENPGMNTDSITLIVLLCALAIGYSLIMLFFRHNSIRDFAFQYVTLLYAVTKLIRIIILFLSYYEQFPELFSQ